MSSRAPWEALHQSLRRSIRTYQAAQRYRLLAASSRALAPFGSGEEVVAYLSQRDGDADQKQAVLEALVKAAQRGEALGTSLLWLGLWPGLDAVYRRGLRLADSPHDLVSDLGGVFTTELAKVNLRSVRRLAATLVRNTERELMSLRRREWKHRRMQVPASAASPHLDEEGDAPAWLHSLEVRGLQEHAPTGSRLEAVVPLAHFGQERAWFLQWLGDQVGADVQLLVAVVVLEASQNEAGRSHGLSHEAARKRFRRALTRARTLIVARMSQVESEPRV